MTQPSATHPPTSNTPAPGLRAPLAGQVYSRAPEMAADIAVPARDDEHVFDFARRLRLGATPEEAVTMMAYALQPRPAVWWGHECLKALPDLLTEQDRAMLGLCAAWVAEPTEPNRYRALDAGLHAPLRGPGAWLALAVGWSGGSMAPEGLPLVAPPPHAMGRAVNAAVLTALARVPQGNRSRMLEHYVSMAEVLAKSS